MKGTIDVRCPNGHVTTIWCTILALSDDRTTGTVLAGSAQDFCDTCDAVISEPAFNLTITPREEPT